MATSSLRTTYTASSETLHNSPLSHLPGCQVENCYYNRRSRHEAGTDETQEHRLTGTTATTTTSATLINNTECPRINCLQQQSVISRDEDGVSSASYETAAEDISLALVQEQNLVQTIMEINLHRLVSNLIA